MILTVLIISQVLWSSLLTLPWTLSQIDIHLIFLLGFICSFIWNMFFRCLIFLKLLYYFCVSGRLVVFSNLSGDILRVVCLSWLDPVQVIARPCPLERLLIGRDGSWVASSRTRWDPGASAGLLMGEVRVQEPQDWCLPTSEWKEVKVLITQYVWLFMSPWTVAHQPPLSMGFSR